MDVGGGRGVGGPRVSAGVLRARALPPAAGVASWSTWASSSEKRGACRW